MARQVFQTIPDNDIKPRIARVLQHSSTTLAEINAPESLGWEACTKERYICYKKKTLTIQEEQSRDKPAQSAENASVQDGRKMFRKAE